jgi:hypothetical protein
MKTLLFVYNANSGLFNTLGDIAHKIFSPKTYACNLCGITHTPLGMRKEWEEFLETLPLKKMFLHADELKSHYDIDDIALPALFFLEEKKPELLADAHSINNCHDMHALEQLIVSLLASKEPKA